MRWLDALTGKAKQTDTDTVKAQMAAAYDAAGRGDHDKALAIWGPLAHAGVPRAQNNIGACFAEGLGVPRDLALALRWLTLSAENRDPVAGCLLDSLRAKPKNR